MSWFQIHRYPWKVWGDRLKLQVVSIKQDLTDKEVKEQGKELKEHGVQLKEHGGQLKEYGGKIKKLEEAVQKISEKGNAKRMNMVPFAEATPDDLAEARALVRENIGGSCHLDPGYVQSYEEKYSQKTLGFIAKDGKRVSSQQGFRKC